MDEISENTKQLEINEQEFSNLLKILAKGNEESYKLLENIPFLRMLKEKLESL